MEKDSVFAKRLRLYRGKKTQSEMADILGISQNYYGHLERGLKLPSFEMIRQIINATGKDANYWFGFEPLKEGIGKEEQGISVDSNLKTIAQRVGAFDELKFSEIHSIISQLYVYLDTRPEPLLPTERRMLSDILAACQRLMDSNEHPRSKSEKIVKVIND